MLTIQTAPIGQNFDGSPSRGFVSLASQAFNAPNDNERAELLSVAIQSGEVQTRMEVVLAPSLADYSTGTFISLGVTVNQNSLNLGCCRCIVPRGWFLYAFTEGPTTTAKTLVVDWHRVTLTGEA
jgi:hypothetical protein